ITHYTFEGDWLGSQALPTAYFGPHFADQGDHLIMVTTREPAFSTEQRLDLSVVSGDAVRQIASTVQELKTANLPCGSTVKYERTAQSPPLPRCRQRSAQLVYAPSRTYRPPRLPVPRGAPRSATLRRIRHKVPWEQIQPRRNLLANLR